MAINFDKAKEKYGGSSTSAYSTGTGGINFDEAKKRYSTGTLLSSPNNELGFNRIPNAFETQRQLDIASKTKPTMADVLKKKPLQKPDYESQLRERKVATPKGTLKQLGQDIGSGELFKSIGRLVTDKEMRKEIKPQSFLESIIKGTDRTQTEKALDTIKRFQEQPFATGLFEGAIPGSQVAKAEKTLGAEYELNPFQLAKETSPGAYTAGDIVGTLSKFMAAAKTVEPLVGKIGFLKPVEGANRISSIAKSLGRMGLINTMIDVPLIATDAIQEGKSAKEVAKEVGIELAVDTAFDTLLMGLGGILKSKKAKKAFDAVQDIAEKQPASQADEAIKSASKMDDIAPPKGVADDAIRAKQLKIEDYMNESLTHGTDRTKELERSYRDIQALMVRNDIDNVKAYRNNIRTLRDELVNADNVMSKMDKLTQMNQKLDQLDNVIARAEAIDVSTKPGLQDVIQGEPSRAMTLEDVIATSGASQATDVSRNIGKTAGGAGSTQTARKSLLFNPAQAETGERRMRQFIENTFKRSENVPDYIKNLAPSSEYSRISTDKMLNLAIDAVTKDPVTARQYWDGLEGITSAQDTAVGEALILKYIKGGNVSEANKVASDLALAATNAGQANAQIMAFQKMTPEGMVMHAHRIINNYNKKAVAKWGKKATLLKLTDADVNKISKYMKEFAETEGRAQKAAMYKAMKAITDKLPVAPAEKMKSFLRISMLLNPKTQVRNVGGNIVLNMAETTKDIPGSVADIVMSAWTGKRTITAGPNVGGFVGGFKEGLSDFMLDVIENVDTAIESTKWDLPRTKVFENKILNALDKTTTRLLQGGDRPFFQAAYNQRLSELAKINNVNINAPTREMVQDATQTALERTFQDTNQYTKVAESFRKTLNKAGSAIGIGTEKFSIGNLILPFTKTPANILRKGVQYSPLELLDLTAKGIKKGGFDQKYFAENIGRMLTGSSIIYLGMRMAKNGDLVSSMDDSRKVRELQYQEGKMPFSIKIGDTWRTFDMFEPIAIPLGVGGEIAQAEFNDEDVIKSLENGLNLFFNKSFLQGITRMMSGYSPAAGILESVMGSSTQAIPTLSGQVADFMDTYYRDISAEGTLKKTANSLQKKIPGLREKLPPKTDILGNPIETYPISRGKATYPLDVFLNPFKMSKQTDNLAMLELLELYKETNSTSHLPQYAPNSLKIPNMDITHKLTNEEQRQFMEIQGDYATELIMRLINNPEYMGYEPEIRQKILEDKMRDVKSMARNDILEIIIGGNYE